MTVAELIAKLQELPQDMLVYVRVEDGYSPSFGPEIHEVSDYEYDAKGKIKSFEPKTFNAVVLS